MIVRWLESKERCRCRCRCRKRSRITTRETRSDSPLKTTVNAHDASKSKTNDNDEHLSLSLVSSFTCTVYLFIDKIVRVRVQQYERIVSFLPVDYLQCTGCLLYAFLSALLVDSGGALVDSYSRIIAIIVFDEPPRDVSRRQIANFPNDFFNQSKTCGFSSSLSLSTSRNSSRTPKYQSKKNVSPLPAHNTCSFKIRLHFSFYRPISIHLPVSIHDLSMTMVADSPQDNKERLLHQSAAIVVWLKEQKLDKTVKKFEKALHKELASRYGKATVLPQDVNGHWKWVMESSEESSDDEEEESSDEEEESESSEYETESSEYEADSEEEEESNTELVPKNITKSSTTDSEKVTRQQPAMTSTEDDTTVNAACVQPPISNADIRRFRRTKSDDDLERATAIPLNEKASSGKTDKETGNQRRGVGRSVSFDSSTPREFLYSPIQKSEKAKAFWSKKELRDMQNEEAMEKMAAVMAGCVIKLPGFTF